MSKLSVSVKGGMDNLVNPNKKTGTVHLYGQLITKM